MDIEIDDRKEVYIERMKVYKSKYEEILKNKKYYECIKNVILNEVVVNNSSFYKLSMKIRETIYKEYRYVDFSTGDGSNYLIDEYFAAINLDKLLDELDAMKMDILD